jgi:hypothetical protein
MPYTPPTVNYSATMDGTYTTLTGVQSVLIRRGRQRIADPFPQSSCVVELIPANSYALPLAIGQFIDVRPTNSSTSRAYFTGKITDVERVYDMPYDSGTGAAPGDRIRITCTGGTGVLATNFGAFTWTAGDATTPIFALQSATNVRIQATATTVNVSAQTVTGGALDVMNTLLNTRQDVIDDSDKKRNVGSPARASEVYVYNTSQAELGYTDYTLTSSSSMYPMKQLEFLSSAQNTFSQVNVEAAGLATQTTNSGSPPYNTLNVDSYNANTADALSLSAYLFRLNSAQLQAAPAVVTTDTTIAPTCTDVLLLTIAGPTYGYIGAPTTVIFRGTTTTAVVQGVAGAFYLDYATVTTYLSPSLGTPFTLDSTVFGILDTNRLGLP